MHGTWKQCANLVAKRGFQFKTARGRTVTVATGARFWVTNTEVDQRRSGLVLLDRAGRGAISHGHAFRPEDVVALFDTED